MQKRRLASVTVYATQQEGGIQGDGRIGISFENGDYTVTELHNLIDGLQETIRTATGKPESPNRSHTIYSGPAPNVR